MEKLFVSGNILIPRDTDLALWSVIACDQYTSQPEYWDGVSRRVGDKPSTLRLILPEAYLERGDTDERTAEINRAMEQYLDEGLFRELEDAFVYVERDMTVGEKRRGLVGLIDLERYDYSADSSSPVHATEGTVESRLPPRVKVRKDAGLELPHIVVFIDDPENRVFGDIEKGELLYDFELMDGGGHIVGCAVTGEGARRVEAALMSLAEPEYLENRYRLGGSSPVVIAMGDGNHSLATAKKCWEDMRVSLSPEERGSHPARFALAELVNIHDKSVVFEPIHRVIFDTEPKAWLDEAEAFFAGLCARGGSHTLRLARGGEVRDVAVTGQTIGGLIAEAQSFCADYTARHGGRLDYIHDDETALEMSAQEGCVGLLLPAMDKNELFPSIMKTGVFPAKSFSIGPSRDKRYYLECRRIK